MPVYNIGKFFIDFEPMLTKHELSAPITNTHHANELELAVKAVFRELVGELLVKDIGQLADYGVPFMSDTTVLERFIKLYGIGVVKQDNNERLLQIILREWLSVASERGLSFLLFLLDMLYPNQYQIIRLYHSKSKAQFYPKAVYENDGDDRFLTSRLRVKMNDDIDLRQLSSLAPTIKRLVPAHIVPTVSVKFEIEPKKIGVAVAMDGIYYFDARVKTEIIRHNRTINHNGKHNYRGNQIG